MSRPTGKQDPYHLEGDEQSNVFVALGKHIQEKPFLYAGGGVFILAVLLFTGFYSVSGDLKARELASEYALAVSLEDPAERAAGLEKIAQAETAFSARALYLQGEAYVNAGDHARAEAAFTRLRESYPDFPFVPDAVEGLGFMVEDRGDRLQAAEIYREVYAKWPDTPAGRRQPFNIARCLEDIGDIEDAIASYREQLQVFPGSTVAFEAQQRLVALRTTHPKLFEIPLDDLTLENDEEGPVSADEDETASEEIEADETLTPPEDE